MAGSSETKSEKSSKFSSQSQGKSRGLTDFKLTIFTNAILISVIAYLLTLVFKKETYTDCGDYFRHGFRADGIYEVKPLGHVDKKFNVYCNMTAGGWTVLMRRGTDLVNVEFQNPLNKYKSGFGDLHNEHFIGLDNIHLLTTVKDRQLLLILNDTHYKVNNFKVLNEFYHYKLIVMDEIDTMSDGTTFLRLNNSLFSAIDVDFDLAANGNCSTGWKAGWWFTDCFDHTICMTCMTLHSSKGVKKFNPSIMLIK